MTEVLPQASRQKVLRRTAWLVSLSFLSPILGLAVELLLVARFGASSAVDAWRIAMLLWLLGRQLLFDNLVPNWLVPAMAQVQARQGAQGLRRFTRQVLIRMLLCVLPMVLLIMLAADSLLDILAPGLSTQARLGSVHLLQGIAPLFLLALISSVLSCRMHLGGAHGFTQGSQILNHLSIAAVLIFGRMVDDLSILLGALWFASCVALVWQIWWILRIEKITESAGVPADSASVQPYRMAALLISFAAIQLSSVLLLRSLSQFGEGTLALYGYAFKLALLVVLVPSSLVVVLFPLLAQQASRSGDGAYREQALRTLLLSLWLACLPVALLLPLSEALARLVFGWPGGLDSESIQKLAEMLRYFLWVAPASVLRVACSKIVYARREAWLITRWDLLLILLFAGFLSLWPAVDLATVLQAFVLCWWLSVLGMLWQSLRAMHYSAARFAKIACSGMAACAAGALLVISLGGLLSPALAWASLLFSMIGILVLALALTLALAWHWGAWKGASTVANKNEI